MMNKRSSKEKNPDYCRFYDFVKLSLAPDHLLVGCDTLPDKVYDGQPIPQGKADTLKTPVCWHSQRNHTEDYSLFER